MNPPVFIPTSSGLGLSAMIVSPSPILAPFLLINNLTSLELEEGLKAFRTVAPLTL